MNTMTDHIPTLETERLVLRAPKMADLPTLTDFFTSPQSHAVGGPRDPVASFNTLAATIGHWAIKGFGSWHIADRETDAFWGRTGFIDMPGWEEPELGWALTADAQGRNIAFEATQAARSYGAAHLGLDGVISYIRPANTRSATLAKRLGAVLEKTHANWRGKPCDVWRHPLCGGPS